MTIQNFFYGAIYYSNLYYLPLYFQNVRLYSPIISAACTISFVIGQSFVSALSGLYVSRFKRYGYGDPFTPYFEGIERQC